MREAVPRGPAVSSYFQEVLLEGLPAAAVERLLAGKSERRFLPNDRIFGAGDPTDGLFVVVEGAVVIRSETVGKPIERVRDLAPGDIFGEIEALSGGPRLFFARALGPTVLHQFAQVPLLRFLSDFPLVETRLRTLGIQRRASRLQMLIAPSTRRDPRIRVDRKVRLALPDGSRLDVRLEDLSHGGACFSEVPRLWQPESPVHFVLGMEEGRELLAVAGVVRWRRGELAGVAFEGGAAKNGRDVTRALRLLLSESVGATL
jgi:CRP-like cAMP-binding protein